MKRITPHEGTAPSWPRPRLEVRDLELVLALATAGTTAGAASSMHITQSAVSRALAQAEERVAARLFERSARGLTPTVAGERLLAGAALVLGQLSELERQVAAPVESAARVRVVCECYTAYRWLPSAMVSLRRRVPRLAVEIVVDHTHDPVGALVRGEIDVALLTTGALPTDRESRAVFREQPLFSDEVIFLVAASHALARRRSLTRADLVEYPLLTASTPPAEARWFMKSVFGRKRPGLELVQLPLTEAIIDAARAGMGVAVLSEWMASGYLGGDDLVLKRLSSGPLRRPWRIAYRRDAADAAEGLIGALQGSAPRLSQGRAALTG